MVLPSYFGDLVNSVGFTPDARRADPRALIDAYSHAAMTLNFARSLSAAGFADLHHPEYWNLNWVGHSPLADEYQRMVDGVGDWDPIADALSEGEPVCVQPGPDQAISPFFGYCLRAALVGRSRHASERVAVQIDHPFGHMEQGPFYTQGIDGVGGMQGAEVNRHV